METNPNFMASKRIEARLELEDLCEKYLQKERTLYTQGFALAVEIRRKIDECYSFGVTTMEVQAIIAKFGQIPS